jgi:hypothetical protein
MYGMIGTSVRKKIEKMTASTIEQPRGISFSAAVVVTKIERIYSNHLTLTEENDTIGMSPSHVGQYVSLVRTYWGSPYELLSDIYDLDDYFRVSVSI